MMNKWSSRVLLHPPASLSEELLTLLLADLLTSFGLRSGDVDDERLQLRARLTQLLNPRSLRLPLSQQVLKAAGASNGRPTPEPVALCYRGFLDQPGAAALSSAARRC